MARIQSLSGFPEWTPEQELLQQRVIRHLSTWFERYGFQALTTRAVEPLSVLASKGGDTDKEIYVLRRLHAQEGDGDAGLALHFDLTVPFARYVSERRGDLYFPYKRYQIQKVWRGERPQQGRYREFFQCDIDVIGEQTLSLRYDGEVVRMLRDVLATLPIPPVVLLVNNRKLLEGLYRGLGIDDITGVLRAVDKRGKIGDKGVTTLLLAMGLSDQAVSTILSAAAIEESDPDVVETRVRALGISHPLIDEGLSELRQVLEMSGGDNVRAALHIARGLDYYTGTVVEGMMVGHEHIGSIASGGRYDNLASSMGGGPQLPGVGVSIGLTRILGYLYGTGLLSCKQRSPCQVMVLLPSEDDRVRCDGIAQQLRDRGVATEVYHRKAGWGKQMKRATQLGIRYAWFPAGEDGQHQVKDLVAGEQSDVDLDTWAPAAANALPLVLDGEDLHWQGLK